MESMRSISQLETKVPTASNKCKLVKSIKPLVNFKFYLDIEKHNVFLKIESKIRELGGEINFFLTEEVTHFITDKKVNKESGDNINSSNNLSKSYTTNTVIYPATNNDLKEGFKIKTRADAMLHRARKGNSECVEKISSNEKSPTHVAKSWGIPIWYTEYALKFLDKVGEFIRDRRVNKNLSTKSKKLGNPKILKGSYIKIEAFERYYRPYYQIINGGWPIINLEVKRNQSIFQNKINLNSTNLNNKKNCVKKEKQDKLNIMTRRNRSKFVRLNQQEKITSITKCGFCEICRVEYDDLTMHLKTDDHINFAKNDNNFIALDTLINSRVNVDAFIKMNKESLNQDDTTEINSRRISKRSIANRVANNNDIQLHKEKSSSEKYQNIYNCRNNFLEITSNYPVKRNRLTGVTNTKMTSPNSKSKNLNLLRSRRESARKVNYAEPKEDDDFEDEISPIIQKKSRRKKIITTKCKTRLSRGTLYKVVDSKKEKQKKNNEEESKKNIQISPIVVKIRKVRQSKSSSSLENSENYTSPKKIHKCLELTDDNKTLNYENSSRLKRRRYNQYDELSENNKYPKRRRNLNPDFSVTTHCNEKSIIAEKLDHTPRNIKSSNGKIDTKNQQNINIMKLSRTHNEKEKIYGKKIQEVLNTTLLNYKYSFERIPKNEPWYKAYTRQDDNTEKMFEYYGSTAYRQLPYEIGPLPSLDRSNCKLYHSLPKPSIIISKLPYTNTENVAEQINTTDIKTTKSFDGSDTSSQNSSKNKITEKLTSLFNNEMPRKSPREHPSTLAMLSCLLRKHEPDNIIKTENESLTVDNNSVQIEKNMTPAKEIRKQNRGYQKLNKELITSKDIPKYNIDNKIKNDIIPQISENVKRLRRGQNRRDSKNCRENRMKSTLIKKPLKRGKKRKPLEVTINNFSNSKKNNLYVDINSKRREIDTFLCQSRCDIDDIDNDLFISDNSENLFSYNPPLTELIAATNKDSIYSTANKKFSLYKLFSHKKRKNNKTGWPTKRRVATRQQSAKIDNITETLTPIENHNSHNYNEERINQNTNENHDFLTASSDSLDTVLDVGSQIKSEDQEKIIANQKSSEICDIKYNSLRVKPIKIVRKVKIQRRGNQIFRLPRRKIILSKRNSNQNILNNICDETLTSIHFTRSSSKTSSDHKTDINLTIDSKNTEIIKSSSPRKLRHPRGKWYRER